MIADYTIIVTNGDRHAHTQEANRLIAAAQKAITAALKASEAAGYGVLVLSPIEDAIRAVTEARNVVEDRT